MVTITYKTQKKDGRLENPNQKGLREEEKTFEYGYYEGGFTGNDDMSKNYEESAVIIVVTGRGG